MINGRHSERKSLVILLLTLSLTLGGCTMSIANPFVDVSKDRNTFEAIDGLRKEGLVVGRSRNPSMFYPDSSLTRAEASALIVEAKFGASFSPPAPVGSVPDVPANYWGAGWIEYALEKELIDLFPDGNFYPRQPATRADIGSLFWEAKQ